MLTQCLPLCVWRLFREGNHDDKGQEHHQRGESIDLTPAEVLGETWSKECRDRSSAVAGAGDAHRETFVLPGKPTGAERERNAETCSRDAEQNSHAEDVVKCFYEQKPVEQREDDGRHLDNRCVLPADVLREDAQWK